MDGAGAATSIVERGASQERASEEARARDRAAAPRTLPEAATTERVVVLPLAKARVKERARARIKERARTRARARDRAAVQVNSVMRIIPVPMANAAASMVTAVLATNTVE